MKTYFRFISLYSCLKFNILEYFYKRVLISYVKADWQIGQNNTDRFAGSFSATFDTGCIIFGKGGIWQTRLFAWQDRCVSLGTSPFFPFRTFGFSATRIQWQCQIKWINLEKFKRFKTFMDGINYPFYPSTYETYNFNFRNITFRLKLDSPTFLRWHFGEIILT